MIVVIGSPAWRSAPTPTPAGRACGIALAAAALGARVELVGRVGEDAAGDALLIALANAGVGHAAILRDPTRQTPRVEPPAPSVEDDGGFLFADPSTDAVPAPAATAASAGPRLDGADVDLAIKYLEPSGVLVVTDDVPSDALAAAGEASGYAHLRLVVLVAPGGMAARTLPAGLPEDATVLAVPDVDAGEAGAFEQLVGAYAAALDGGADPSDAFTAAQGATGWAAAASD